ncbi:hypothetical protein T08_9842 [Trichinella sp. T8]|nr:hypothetical protein T08_9842 [Trichinella sp. T8]
MAQKNKIQFNEEIYFHQIGIRTWEGNCDASQLNAVIGNISGFRVSTTDYYNSHYVWENCISNSALPGTEIVSNWRHLPDDGPVYARAWRPSCLPGACILLLVCLFLTGLKRRRRR